MSRAAIDRWVTSYLRRDSFTQDQVTDAIEAATVDIGELLRDSSNIVEATAAAGSTYPLPLPLNYREMYNVEADQQGGTVSLRSVPIANLNRVSAAYRNLAGSPASVYAVENNELHVAPGPGGELRYSYYAEPDPITTDPVSTNEVLQRKPALYRYRVLAELSMVAQDFPLSDKYLGWFSESIAAINRQHKWSRQGDAPARRRA